MTSHRSAPHSASGPLPPFARPDGSCLGHHPEEEDEETVPAAPAEPDDASVEPDEPMNPA